MTANKMPEMPEAEEFIWWMGINENHKARAAKRYYTHDEVVATRRACYLAGLEAAKSEFAPLAEKKLKQANMADHPNANDYGRGAASAMRTAANEMNMALANLEALEEGVAKGPALEQEAKK